MANLLLRSCKFIFYLKKTNFCLAKQPVSSTPSPSSGVLGLRSFNHSCMDNMLHAHLIAKLCYRFDKRAISSTSTNAPPYRRMKKGFISSSSPAQSTSHTIVRCSLHRSLYTAFFKKRKRAESKAALALVLPDYTNRVTLFSPLPTYSFILY